jgi:hypothetical protein
MINFESYSDEDLKHWLGLWETHLQIRTLIPAECYAKARYEAFKRWKDNSCYYALYFSKFPEDTISDFISWYDKIISN